MSSKPIRWGPRTRPALASMRRTSGRLRRVLQSPTAFVGTVPGILNRSLLFPASRFTREWARVAISFLSRKRFRTTTNNGALASEQRGGGEELRIRPQFVLPGVSTTPRLRPFFSRASVVQGRRRFSARRNLAAPRPVAYPGKLVCLLPLLRLCP